MEKNIRWGIDFDTVKGNILEKIVKRERKEVDEEEEG